MSRRRELQRGVAMAEFAIVLPLLLLLMMAILEMGRAYNEYDALTKAVRNGARYYAKKQNVYNPGTTALNPTGQANAKNVVVYGLPTGSSNGAQPILNGLSTGNVSTAVTTVASGEYVTVTANYTFNFSAGNPLGALMGIFGSGLANTLTMNASVVMRVI
jgi:Flp pilus assembly protein TadG